MNFPQSSKLPTIDGINLGETIGKGSFAVVKKASLTVDPSTVLAIKFIHKPSCRKNGLKDEDVSKEVLLHSMCSNHDNVLKVLDCSISKDFLWIAMEMAEGGDLFDKIEPDVGVDIEVAQFYFQQLVNAIEYLHESCGVSHRDIKPENILLDRDGNLKLADFGLATVFRRKDGTKRISKDQRGSLPYMAPEIIYCDGYYSDITDIWSIGTLVFVLLTGEIPWEIPHEDDASFTQFVKGEGKISHGSWMKIGLFELNLLRKILQPDPERRATLSDLKSHTWYQNRPKFVGNDGLCNNPELLAKKLLSKLKFSLLDQNHLLPTQDQSLQKRTLLSATQPLESAYAKVEYAHLDNDNCHPTSQKMHLNEEHTIYPFMTQGQPNNNHAIHDIIQPNLNEKISRISNFSSERLTKFFSTEDLNTILSELQRALLYNGVPVKQNLSAFLMTSGDSHTQLSTRPIIIQIKTNDRNKMPLSGTIVISHLDATLKSIFFDKKRGDPLEWRRLFKKIAFQCNNIISIK